MSIPIANYISPSVKLAAAEMVEHELGYAAGALGGRESGEANKHRWRS
jgi:hypothetical protein